MSKVYIVTVEEYHDNSEIIGVYDNLCQAKALAATNKPTPGVYDDTGQVKALYDPDIVIWECPLNGGGPTNVWPKEWAFRVPRLYPGWCAGIAAGDDC